jgi:hypothetical protein
LNKKEFPLISSTCDPNIPLILVLNLHNNISQVTLFRRAYGDEHIASRVQTKTNAGSYHKRKMTGQLTGFFGAFYGQKFSVRKSSYIAGKFPHSPHLIYLCLVTDEWMMEILNAAARELSLRMKHIILICMDDKIANSIKVP